MLFVQLFPVTVLISECQQSRVEHTHSHMCVQQNGICMNWITAFGAFASKLPSICTSNEKYISKKGLTKKWQVSHIISINPTTNCSSFVTQTMHARETKFGVIIFDCEFLGIVSSICIYQAHFICAHSHNPFIQKLCIYLMSLKWISAYV